LPTIIKLSFNARKKTDVATMQYRWIVTLCPSYFRSRMSIYGLLFDVWFNAL